MKSGYYRAECSIPPYLLNEGAYAVGVAVTSYHDCGERYTVNFFEKNILSFIVSDTKTPDKWNYGFATTVPGIIRPRLSWKIQEVSKGL
jgi:lipopolysaccharide transport system ATP-binding protein